jgi:hypothetical protein
MQLFRMALTIDFQLISNIFFYSTSADMYYNEKKNKYIYIYIYLIIFFVLYLQITQCIEAMQEGLRKNIMRHQVSLVSYCLEKYICHVTYNCFYDRKIRVCPKSINKCLN